MGKEPERLLDAVLQFLDSGLSYSAETQSPPLPSVYAFVGSALIEMVGRLGFATFDQKALFSLDSGCLLVKTVGKIVLASGYLSVHPCQRIYKRLVTPTMHW